MRSRRSCSRPERTWMILALAIGFLLLPAAAKASPPTLTAAGQSARHLTASWTLPPGMANDFIEAATNPGTDADGYFLAPIYQDVLGDATTYLSPVQLPPGTYYVHVAAYDPNNCVDPTAPECIDEFSSPPVAVTFPPDPPAPAPPPPPRPPPPPPPDTVTTFSALSAPSRQKVAKLYVLAGMGERGTLTARGSVSVPGASKVYKFKTVSANAVPGASVRLKLKLPAKALKAVKKALKRHKKLKAKLTIVAKDLAGNAKTEKRTIALKP
jgi:hypothetical protein